MPDRALSFGANVTGYDRYRPAYPDEVIDRILAYASSPVVRAIEIGAGTGKATTMVAARGIAVTAVEPDPLMLAVLEHKTAGFDVTPMLSSFDEVLPSGDNDLLYAAAAWHWTEPGTRWPQAASLVRAGGTVAFFAAPMKLADEAVRQAVEQARQPLPPEDEPPGRRPAHGAMQWPGTELLDSSLFTDVEQQVLPRTAMLAAGDYVGFLATVSAYLQLVQPDRDDALRRVRAVLPDPVKVRCDLVLHLARRV